MLHPKIVLFKPFNLLIEHNQHFYLLAATISLLMLYIYIYTTEMNYTNPNDNDLNDC